MNNNNNNNNVKMKENAICEDIQDCMNEYLSVLDKYNMAKIYNRDFNIKDPDITQLFSSSFLKKSSTSSINFPSFTFIDLINSSFILKSLLYIFAILYLSNTDKYSFIQSCISSHIAFSFILTLLLLLLLFIFTGH